MRPARIRARVVRPAHDVEAVAGVESIADEQRRPERQDRDARVDYAGGDVDELVGEELIDLGDTIDRHVVAGDEQRE